MTCADFDEIMQAARMWSDTEAAACLRHVIGCKRCQQRNLEVNASLSPEWKQKVAGDVERELNRVVGKMILDAENRG